MGHNVTVLRFKKKILNKSINISSRFHSGHFYFRLCWRKKSAASCISRDILYKISVLHVQTDYFPVLQHWKLGPKHKNQNHSKDFSYGSFSPAKVYNQRCSSFFSLLGIYMDLEKGLQRENQVEMTFFQCCTEFTISREAWHSCFMRFCRWKMPKSEVNTDHNENLFIKILLGSRQCASSFTTISWWLDFYFLFN